MEFVLHPLRLESAKYMAYVAKSVWLSFVPFPRPFRIDLHDLQEVSSWPRILAGRGLSRPLPSPFVPSFGVSESDRGVFVLLLLVLQMSLLQAGRPVVHKLVARHLRETLGPWDPGTGASELRKGIAAMRDEHLPRWAGGMKPLEVFT